MALDREDTLKKAEKLLRQGRLDAAIAEYVRVVEDQPRDWNTANTLGDLYMRAAQTPAAVAQFARIGEHFLREGFYPKAGALFKKILKISPDDETAQLHLAEISARQGLLADAKSYFGAVATRRQARGDRRGAEEIAVRLGDLDPADFDARLAAARIVAQSGDDDAAAARFRQIADDLFEKGRKADALEALREAVRFNPRDNAGRAVLASEALAAGDLDGARSYLDRETAGGDPALMLALADIELRSGQLETARDILPTLLALDPNMRDRVTGLAWALTATKPGAAFVCVEAVVQAAKGASDLADAASILEEYVARVPHQIPALLRLVEVCDDGGFEGAKFEAQAQLADAYLHAGQPSEARVIAEDLIARQPWEPTHIERFRKSLVLLNVEDPDAVIADRLSGQRPFTATETSSGSPTAATGTDAEASGHADTDQSAPPEVPLAREEQLPASFVIPQPAAVPKPAPVALEPPAPPARPLGPMEIDLTSVLAEFESPGPAPMSPPSPPREELKEVFQDFRSEVTRQAGTDDAAQHIALANTYLEMGMEDDAIHALRTAARSPRHRFDAGTLLARLFLGRKDMTQAVEWMERAAEAPAPSKEAGFALLYDLGTTLEGMGETARALAVFMELQADSGQYRDVNERVERLSRVQTGG